jgi:hypothetical protein
MNACWIISMIYRGSRSSTCVILVTTFILVFAIFFMFPGSTSVYGVELSSKDEIPYDIWVPKYWNWWISLSTDEAIPKPNGCLINKSESLVMLMETAVGSTRNQICNIQSTDHILIPMWIGWCDTSPDKNAVPKEPMWKCAKEESNQGVIRSEVKVDGVPVANLDVTNYGKDGIKINSPLVNVTELSTANFELIIPTDSHKRQFTFPGKWIAGSHGWWVALESLPRGEHTVYYSAKIGNLPGVSGEQNPVEAYITYLFKVK